MTTNELRTNIKQALDKAEQGKVITITRRGKVFVLKLAEVK